MVPPGDPRCRLGARGGSVYYPSVCIRIPYVVKYFKANSKIHSVFVRSQSVFVAEPPTDFRLGVVANQQSSISTTARNAEMFLAAS